MGDLAGQDPPQLGQLGVACRRDPLRHVVQALEGPVVLLQVAPPARGVEFRQAIAARAADCELVVFLVLVGQRLDAGVARCRRTVRGGLQPGGEAPVEVLHLVDDASHGEREGVHGALQPLQQIHPQHADQPPLAVALIEAVALLLAVQGRGVLEIARRVVERQPEGADAAVQIVVGEFAGAVARRMQVLRFGAPRESADRGVHLRVEAAHVGAGAGDGYGVEQRQEIGAQARDEGVLVRSARVGLGAAALPFPLLELALRHPEQTLQIGDAERLPKRILPPFGHQIDLIAQVAQGGVDRRGRQHQDLAAHAVLQHLLQQPVIAAAAHDLAGLVGAVAPLVAEVVRLVDHHQIERPPVEVGQVDLPGAAGRAAQVGVREHGVIEAIRRERVVGPAGPGGVAQPVVLQPLGAQHQHPFVAQLEELDHRQRGPGLAQADAVGDDAAVVPQQAVDGAGRAVPLELVEAAPDRRVVEMDVVQQAGARAAFGQPVLEHVEQGLVVDEARRVGAADPVQRFQHLLLGVLGAGLVPPQIVEPVQQGGAVGGGSDVQVEFQVGRRAVAQAAPREVGAADQGRVGAVAARHVVELAVQEVGPGDGTDVDAPLDPLGAGAGERLLRQRVLQIDAAVLGQAERLGFFGGRVDPAHAARLAVEEAGMGRLLQRAAQLREGVDGEVGGHDRQPRAGVDLLAQHVPYPAAHVVHDGAGDGVPVRHHAAVAGAKDENVKGDRRTARRPAASPSGGRSPNRSRAEPESPAASG